MQQKDFAQRVGNLKPPLRIARLTERHPEDSAFGVEVADHSHQCLCRTESQENLHQDSGRSGIQSLRALHRGGNELARFVDAELLLASSGATDW